MATKRKRKKSGAGTAVYVVILVLWTLFVAAVAMYILSQVWKYASVYDETQVEPVMEEYISKLRENVWEEKIDLYFPIDIKCQKHPQNPMNLFCLDEKGKLKII